jgi:hypothetical protein
VRTLLLEDIASDPRRAWLDILGFLGVPDDGRTTFPTRNVAKAHRIASVRLLDRMYAGLRHRLRLPPMRTGILGALHRANVRPRPRSPLTGQMRAELAGFFRPEVRKLERLLDRDLSHWLVGRDDVSGSAMGPASDV